MSDARFVSGPWTGFYLYRGEGRRHRMDLALHFGGGRMSGAGTDDLGRFTIGGGYNPETGECDWAKTYVGAHSVAYRGFAEGKGIWGTWEIDPDFRGGFHIWPLGEEPAEHARESVQIEEPIGVGTGT